MATSIAVKDKDGNAVTVATIDALMALLPAALAANGGLKMEGVASGVPVPVVGVAALPSASFTRPADTTPYAVGDLVANSATAGSVTPMQFTVARVAAGSGFIRRCRLRKSGTSVTNAQFRLHLYSASPTPANGDNGAWSTDQSANYIGAFDITVDRAFTDGAAGNGLPVNGSEVNFALASGQVVYGLAEARAAYTPGNGETFAFALEVGQN